MIHSATQGGWTVHGRAQDVCFSSPASLASITDNGEGEEPGSVRDGFPIGAVMSDVKSSPAERENKWRRSASQTLSVSHLHSPLQTEFHSQQLTVCFLCSSRLCMPFLPLHSKSTYGCRMVYKDHCNTGLKFAFLEALSE